jgi:hypothetical protein
MISKSAIAPENLLDELQATLAHGTVARRVETLRRVTDLFLSGAVGYSDEQIGLFDDVFQCLMEHIETSAGRCSPTASRRSTPHRHARSGRWHLMIRSRWQGQCCRNRCGSTTKP